MKLNLYPDTFLKHIQIVFVALMVLSGIGATAQTITVISPNGGEEWLTQTSQTITWEISGSQADLMIEYTLDGGTYWYYLAYVPSSDTSGIYTFQNYLSATSQARIRVSLYDDPSINDESDSNFTVIESPVYFYTPWPGEEYYRNAPMDISWYSSTIDTADLEYTTDNGSTWNLIVTDFVGDEYTWTTPDVLSDECKIRLRNSNNPDEYGLSPQFSLVELPMVNLVEPNGGETWNYGQLATVSYTGTNLPYYMFLEYSINGGQDWYYLGYAYGSDTGGTADVYVPMVNTDSARVRISDSGNPDAVSDESDANFTIYTPPVIVYYPSQGQQFYNGSQASISWLATGVDSVNIELTTNGGQSWQVVEENLSAYYGYYYWTVSGTPSSDCQIRISDAADPSSFGVSGVFTILETPVITLTSPSAGDIWNTNTEYAVTWNYDNQDSYYVMLDYSLDGGETWQYIGYIPNTSNQGSYNWTTPDVESDSCLFRIRDYSMSFVSDTSDLFTIITFPETPICMVTVDSVSNNNLIVWERPVSDLIQNFIIYKESDQANIYQAIGTTSYTDIGVFQDTNSNPSVKSYRYKIGFEDADGNMYPMSDLHQTIHLSINKGVGNSWNLIWTDYLGFDFGSYRIYRGTDPDSMTMVTSISSSFNSYTDFDAPEGYIYYMVEVVNPFPCNPEARSENYFASRSNVATNYSLGIDDPSSEIKASVYPNPASSFLYIRTDTQMDEDATLEVSDLLGKSMAREFLNSSTLNSGYKLNLDNMPEGIYMLRIVSGKAATVRKIVIRR